MSRYVRWPFPSLRATLAADAAACFAFGGALAWWPAAGAAALTPADAVGGCPAPAALRALGVGVLAVGAWCLGLARRPLVPRAGVVPVLAVELAWLLAGGALLARRGAALTEAGAWVTAASMAAVAAFFALELRGLVRERPGRRGAGARVVPA